MIELDTGEIVQISRIPRIDAIVEGQIEGLDWLDSVDHLLEKDAEGSRTQAYSVIEIDIASFFSSQLDAQAHHRGRTGVRGNAMHLG